MIAGVYLAKKKNGTPYYRASVQLCGKHISLGSFNDEDAAHRAYLESKNIFSSSGISLLNFSEKCHFLTADKIITLLNYRDNGIYIKTPIYLREGYFSYFLNENTELKFDNDDLFYYSSHRILSRQGHLYVNDYGMQYSILNRYGIRNFAVSGRDYTFSNGDSLDFRYGNIVVLSHYHGVTRFIGADGRTLFQAKIHLNGDFLLGRFVTEEYAAAVYNKAVDYAIAHNYPKNFIQNYITEYSASEYNEVYEKIQLPRHYREYIRSRLHLL